jgi:GPH family glycoside/pentoside/hexuronide:cation symporter
VTVNSERIGWRVLAAYAAPAFAFAMPTIPVYVYLPALYADTLGLATAGALLAGARILDVVSDPLIGVLSDKSGLKRGRRRTWVLCGAPPAAIALIMLFSGGADDSWLAVLLWLCVLYLGWTAVMVPYAAWGAELSDDYRERARLTGAREGAGLFGLLAAGAVPAIAQQAGWDEREGLVALCWLAVGVGAVGLIALARRVPDPPARPLPPGQIAARWRETARQMRANGPFVRLLSAWFVNGLANGLPAVTFLIYLEHVLKVDAGARAWLVFAYFLAAALSLPLWNILLKRFDKHRLWCGAMILAIAAFALVPAIPAGGIVAFTIVCIVTGAALGADLALPPALQADVIDLHTLRHGEARAGLYFAVWSMVTKLALAVAAGIGLGGLAALGFDTSAAEPGSPWPVLVIYAGIPTVLKVIAVVIVGSYPIGAKRHAIIRRRLQMRRSNSQ